MLSLRSAAGILWELPQSALGALVFGLAKVFGQALETEREGSRRVVRSKGLGISLGHFVFYTESESRYFRRDPMMRAHELGHTVQSRRLGPLYLPVVGTTSTARVFYAVLHRELTGERWRGYYAGFPENAADRLGGISPSMRAAQLSGD